jgi:hypothetical protein
MKTCFAFSMLALLVIPCTGAYAFDPRPDLQGTTMTLKLKCTDAGGCNVRNATFVFTNSGAQDAANSFLEFWLSDDTIFDPSVDTLVKRVAIGKLKSGKTKKRTMGNGLIQEFTMNKHILAVLDIDNVVEESDESNNVFPSEPLPAQN